MAAITVDQLIQAIMAAILQDQLIQAITAAILKDQLIRRIADSACWQWIYAKRRMGMNILLQLYPGEHNFLHGASCQLDHILYFILYS
jgi:hypothetical protein